jgi:AcrR family transcriptional regulator
MGSDKVDRRVKYTKLVLRESSFISLLEKKDISQITIKEICEDADINRATFYAHYKDQYDLRHKIEDELLENVSSYFSGFPKSPADLNMVPVVKKIFDYIKENARICRLLLSERGDLNFQKRIMTLIYDEHINLLTRGAGRSREEADYIHSYIITGCVGAVQKWLDSGMKQSPLFMAQLLVKLNSNLPTSFYSA